MVRYSPICADSAIKPQTNKQTNVKHVQEVQSRFPDGLPPLDPVDDMGITDHGLSECVKVCLISRLP